MDLNAKNLAPQPAHTPGPWATELYDRQTYNTDTGAPATRYQWQKILAPDGRTLGIAHECEAMDANARLIAAAPDLLKELRMLVLQTCGDKALEGAHRCQRCTRALDAIAKATGGAE
jgi:hypothetical protein